MREASSLVLIRRLLDAGARIRAHDPEAMTSAEEQIGHSAVQFFTSPYEALAGSDALAIMTEWKVFRSPDFVRIREALKMPLIFDGRNLFEPSSVAASGIEYHAIGRPVVMPD